MYTSWDCGSRSLLFSHKFCPLFPGNLGYPLLTFKDGEWQGAEECIVDEYRMCNSALVKRLRTQSIKTKIIKNLK